MTENTTNLTENTTNLTEKQERYKKVSRINKNIINQYYTKKLIQSLHTIRICCIFSQIYCIFSQICCIFNQVYCILFQLLIFSSFYKVCYIFAVQDLLFINTYNSLDLKIIVCFYTLYKCLFVLSKYY
jgi:hypothetical protein